MHQAVGDRQCKHCRADCGDHEECTRPQGHGQSRPPRIERHGRPSEKQGRGGEQCRNPRNCRAHLLTGECGNDPPADPPAARGPFHPTQPDVGDCTDHGLRGVDAEDGEPQVLATCPRSQGQRYAVRRANAERDQGDRDPHPGDRWFPYSTEIEGVRGEDPAEGHQLNQCSGDQQPAAGQAQPGETLPATVRAAAICSSRVGRGRNAHLTTPSRAAVP